MLWSFLALRARFALHLPDPPAVVADLLAARVVRRAPLGFFGEPHLGEHLVGTVSRDGFGLASIVGGRHPDGRTPDRLVLATGRFTPEGTGTRAEVVVRKGWVWVALNGLLLALALACGVGWLLLAVLSREFGFSPGLAGVALVLAPLWVLVNVGLWGEVQAARKHLARELTDLVEPP